MTIIPSHVDNGEHFSPGPRMIKATTDVKLNPGSG